MVYNIAICDDEIIQVEFVEKLINEIKKEKNIKIKLNKFSSGEQILSSANIIQYHIILLDMEMEQINGIEVAKRIRHFNEQALIIFITGFKDYVFNVFEVKTFRYLLKPLDKQLFYKAFIEAIEIIDVTTTNFRDFLHVKKNKQDIIVSYESIQYFEKYKNKVLIVTENGEIEFYGTMNELILLLNMEKFIRVHQGYIVNIDNIELITSKEVILKEGKRIPVSRRNVKEVKEAFLSRMRV
jgi:DNA-binding LytR/AlgR family response regulator